MTYSIGILHFSCDFVDIDSKYIKLGCMCTWVKTACYGFFQTKFPVGLKGHKSYHGHSTSHLNRMIV